MRERSEAAKRCAGGRGPAEVPGVVAEVAAAVFG